MKKGKTTEFIKQAEKQEVAEFEMLNARSDENHKNAVAEQNRAADIIRKAEEKAKKAAMKAEEEEEKAWRKSYTAEVALCALIFGTLSALLVCAGLDGLISPKIWIPVSVFLLCAICLSLGEWFGRVVRK